MDLTVKGTWSHNPWKIFLVAFINHDMSIFVLDDIKQLDFFPWSPTKHPLSKLPEALYTDQLGVSIFYLSYISQNIFQTFST